MSKAARHSKTSFAQKCLRLLASRRFFWVIVGLFVLQALWIALTGRYPMAFDEDFHLGIIRLYAHHVVPVWSGQPPGANGFGAVTRDPSYMYQYLMSFPYRLINLLTHDQTIQVLILRFINIGLLASALPIYRRLLRTTGASMASVQSCLLVLVLLPVMPLLGAQINYDNLFIPVVGLTLLWTIRWVEGVRHNRPPSTRLMLQIVCLCLFGSLVKYAFLPIFLAVMLYMAWELRVAYPTWRRRLTSIGFGWTLMTRPVRRSLVALVVVMSALFAQRYVVNTVRYHNPVPACNKVLSVKACSAYGPWIRDYNFEINKVDEEHNPLVFTADWFYGMWLRLFFAVDGPQTNFETRGPLLLPALGSIVFAGMGTVALLRYGRQLWRRTDRVAFGLLILTGGIYLATLWLDEFQAYVRTGQPVAINGRYLLPVLPVILLLVGQAITLACRRKNELKAAILGLAVVSLLWGGGALTYILRSRDVWYWPARPVRDANHAVQKVFDPLVPGSRGPTAFLH